MTHGESAAQVWEATRGNCSDWPSTRAIDRKIGLPRVECNGTGGCGVTWAESLLRVRVEPPDGGFVKDGVVVSVAQMNLLRNEARETMGIPESVRLPPGTEFGLLHVECDRATTLDVEWPQLNGMVVSQRLQDALATEGLTGWDTSPAVVERYPMGEPPPTLTELLVIGRGGEAALSPPMEVKSVCAECGRVEWRNDRLLSFNLNLSEWDGSDVFRFNPPLQGYIWVTERWVRALEKYNIEGIGYRSTDEVVDIWNRYV